MEPKESQQILEKDFERKIEREELGPELIDRAKILAKATAMMSFNYCGASLVAKHDGQH